jgi:hypothetical protein
MKKEKERVYLYWARVSGPLKKRSQAGAIRSRKERDIAPPHLKRQIGITVAKRNQRGNGPIFQLKGQWAGFPGQKNEEGRTTITCESVFGNPQKKKKNGCAAKTCGECGNREAMAKHEGKRRHPLVEEIEK